MARINRFDLGLVRPGCHDFPASIFKSGSGHTVAYSALLLWPDLQWLHVVSMCPVWQKKTSFTRL